MLNFVYIPSPLSDLKTGLEWEKKKKKNLKKFCFFVLNNILPFFLEASFCEKIIDVSANVLCYSRRIPSKNLCFVFSYTDFFFPLRRAQLLMLY